MHVNDISDSYTRDELVSTTEIRECCTQCALCALTSVQLLASSGETELAGPDAVRRTACICLHFMTFKTLAVWQPFLPTYLQGHICECFDFSGFSLKTDMNMTIVKYVQDIGFSQLNLTEQTDVKNLGRATPDLVVSHHQADYKLVSQNLTLLYTLNIGV